MEALTKIEIEFARLRDRFYLERMAEVEQERKGVLNRTHPELLHLLELIELRRAKKLDLAERWLTGLEGSYKRRREAEEHTAWTNWAGARDGLRIDAFDEANAKRRKLDREKRALERARDDSLTPVLMPKPLNGVPLRHVRRAGWEGPALTETEIIFALRHPDLRVDAGVSNLDEAAAWGDLEEMGVSIPTPPSPGSLTVLTVFWFLAPGSGSPTGPRCVRPLRPSAVPCADVWAPTTTSATSALPD